jgi:hypothetical protein
MNVSDIMNLKNMVKSNLLEKNTNNELNKTF